MHGPKQQILVCQNKYLSTLFYPLAINFSTFVPFVAVLVLLSIVQTLRQVSTLGGARASGFEQFRHFGAPEPQLKPRRTAFAVVSTQEDRSSIFSASVSHLPI